jgi:hypothetical protein
MTLQELIDKATLQAGLDAQGSPARTELVANSLLGQVFHDVAKGYDDAGSVLPQLTKTLTFANGAATLTSDVLTGDMFDSVLYDPADTDKDYSLVPEWNDFMKVYDPRIGYYTFSSDSINAIEPGDVYVDGSGTSGTRKLVIACVPTIPALATSAIVAPAEFTNRALDMLVERLRGKVAA